VAREGKKLEQGLKHPDEFVHNLAQVLDEFEARELAALHTVLI